MESVLSGFSQRKLFRVLRAKIALVNSIDVIFATETEKTFLDSWHQLKILNAIRNNLFIPLVKPFAL